MRKVAAMAVYVDELRNWPTVIRCFKDGSCHMWADSLEELHTFARRLGLRRGWFQDHTRLKHYDLTAERRQKALQLGALEASLKAYFVGVLKSEKGGGDGE